MISMAAKLTNDHLEQIASYLSDKFPILKGGPRSKQGTRDIDIEFRERFIPLEEELKHQGDNIRDLIKSMDKRFEQVDRRFEQADKRSDELRADMNSRFEQVDKRFEDINKRFSMMMLFMGIGFTLVTAFISGVMVLLK